MEDYAIGIDIGGTKIAAAIVHKSGKIVHQLLIPTPKENRQGILTVLHQVIHSLAEKARQESLLLQGIGIGAAGQIDFERGRVLSGTTNIVDWNDVPLRDEISRITPLPIWVDNDVNVMALAEHQLGVARGEENVVCLTLGTGVGGGVISGGRLLRGAWGGAAELGHISVDMNGPICNCGLRGCLETYVSGSAIARALGVQPISNDLVSKWMEEGDSSAVAVVDQMITALSYGIVNIIHTFNPTMIILGGGVMNHNEWICQSVQGKISSLGIRSLVDSVKIKMAKLGPESGLIGAAYQCWV